MSESKIWICRSCVWNARIIVFRPLRKEIHDLRGDKYLCLHCAIAGYLSDPDAPIQVTEAQADKYWPELQTDKLFIPPA